MLAMRSRSQTRQDRNPSAPTTARSGDSSNPPSSSSSPFAQIQPAVRPALTHHHRPHPSSKHPRSHEQSPPSPALPATAPSRPPPICVGEQLTTHHHRPRANGHSRSAPICISIRIHPPAAPSVRRLPAPPFPNPSPSMASSISSIRRRLHVASSPHEPGSPRSSRGLADHSSHRPHHPPAQI